VNPGCLGVHREQPHPVVMERGDHEAVGDTPEADPGRGAGQRPALRGRDRAHRRALVTSWGGEGQHRLPGQRGDEPALGRLGVAGGGHAGRPAVGGRQQRLRRSPGQTSPERLGHGHRCRRSATTATGLRGVGGPEIAQCCGLADRAGGGCARRLPGLGVRGEPLIGEARHGLAQRLVLGGERGGRGCGSGCHRHAGYAPTGASPTGTRARPRLSPSPTAAPARGRLDG
jgi:hypothetical protein